jgi:ribosome-binding protein aMBF1 (putative translation factor)
MDEQGWQTVSNKKSKQKVNTDQEKFSDPIIARQIQRKAKLDADKQESMKVKYDGSKDPNQDWNYITISKTKPKPKVSLPQGIPTTFKETEEGGIIKIKKVSKAMGKAVTDARIAKQWTQVQLAHNSTVDSKTIGEIERGCGVYDSNIFNKISKALGVKIERNYDLI